MYKTNYRLSVVLAADSAISAFEDSQEHPGAATAALAQIKSCRDVDSVGEEANTIIPYHAIDYAVVEATRSEESDPVDDNCNTGDPAEPGTLKIVNNYGSTVMSILVLISEALDGTYGDLTFSTTPPEGVTFPDGYHAWATVTELANGATVNATGLPDGTNVSLTPGFEGAVPLYANVPATITITNPDPGPGPK